MRGRTAVSAFALAGVLVLATGSAQAAPGALDSSFGTGGKVTTTFGPGVDYGNAAALQADGKIVVAGSAAIGSGTAFALVRYNADGSLDSGFGTAGKVTTVFGTFSGATAVEVQSDGKIVAAGQSYNGSNTDFALARYNSDGSLDSSFGVGGKVTTSVRSKSDGALTLALQSDGKIVAAGYSEDTTFTDDFALVRYNADGLVDTSFGSGGMVVTAIGSDHDDVNAVLLQPDGKIVAVGYGKQASTYQFAVVRYNPDGSLDSSFGSAGTVTTSIGSLDDEAFAGALQPDGKIVAAGFTKVGSNRYFGLARYNPDGSLDSGFGSGGKVTTPIGTNDNVNDLALQPDGRIVAAGYTGGTTEDFALARYTTDGSLDSAFGTGGKVITSIAENDVARAVELQPDGKIVAAGLSITGSDWDFAVVRYLGNTLTVTKAGSGGGTVASSPAGIDCGSTCSSPFAAVSVTLTATAAAKSFFTGWSGDCSGRGTCKLTMSADHTATARFQPACFVPKVKGKKLAAAKSAIKRRHCGVGKVTRAFSAKVKRGVVISQNPTPGKKLRPGSKVKLKVSKGKT